MTMEMSMKNDAAILAFIDLKQSWKWDCMPHNRILSENCANSLTGNAIFNTKCTRNCLLGFLSAGFYLDQLGEPLVEFKEGIPSRDREETKGGKGLRKGEDTFHTGTFSKFSCHFQS